MQRYKGAPINPLFRACSIVVLRASHSLGRKSRLPCCRTELTQYILPTLSFGIAIKGKTLISSQHEQQAHTVELRSCRFERLKFFSSRPEQLLQGRRDPVCWIDSLLVLPYHSVIRRSYSRRTRRQRRQLAVYKPNSSLIFGRCRGVLSPSQAIDTTQYSLLYNLHKICL